jgi:hypothetical protein
MKGVRIVMPLAAWLCAALVADVGVAPAARADAGRRDPLTLKKGPP